MTFKYTFYILPLFFLCIGCGEDPSNATPTAPISASAAQVQATMDKNLPIYQKMCIQNNEDLFDSQYATCLPVYGKSRCDADLDINKKALASEWEDIQAETKAQLMICTAQGMSGDLCFAQQQFEISRRSEFDCRAKVLWL